LLSKDYLDDGKNFIQDINVVVEGSAIELTSQFSTVSISICSAISHLIYSVIQMAPNKRYAETPSLAVHSGNELGHDQEMDDLVARDVEGDLDVDLAELSLGQRLSALSGGDEGRLRGTSSDSESEATGQHPKATSKREKKQGEAPVVVPANSLTRTLIQALHSSDSGLLETCLAHSDQTLIRNTVQRLPPQLTMPLITACMERLGRSARAGTMKGGGGGASSQRATGLVKWVKAVLVVHSGHLMTVYSAFHFR
jgi:U3 small nucleolar RNA-associated protein 5